MNGTSKSGGTKPDEKTAFSPYEDMLELPHHVSSVHPPMPLCDRAAQFAPFRALSGHEQVLHETARLTDSRIELDEERIHSLNAKMLLLQEYLDEQPEITVTFFLPDARKEGGSYQTISGTLKKIILPEGTLVFRSGEKIPVQNVIRLESSLFTAFNFL